jgi:outer membrane protein OmpA-like peptidoglycan-associated protein
VAAQEAAGLRAELEAEHRAQAEAERERARSAQRDAEQRLRQAEAEKGEIRARLLKQFSLVLETRDTERGLIVNMPDILFESGKYTLRPEAREKLARIGGIVVNYPKLRIEAEGHTDNVGSAAYNQKLSEQRAYEVRCYLITQGVPFASMQWSGKGFDAPLASNDTAAGRRQNRRVELIVSGEVIGTAAGRADQ